MNDGISQDSWDRVVDASQRLESTGAERFGVALGGQVRKILTIHVLLNMVFKKLANILFSG